MISDGPSDPRNGNREWVPYHVARLSEFSFSRPDGTSSSTPSNYQAPPPPRRPRRRWAWFGCLPAVLLAVVLLVVILLLVARQRDGEIERSNGTVLPPNTVTTPVPDSAAVTATCAITQGLITRECAIITPPSVAAGTRLPVVFLLAGLGDGPVEVRGTGDWANAVVARNFMLVTPSGISNSWNAGTCCGIAKATEIDDVTYLSTLIDEISRRPDVDPARIYLAGFSNGGMMVYRMLCSTDRLAGAASVSGTKVVTCPSKKPIDLLHIHGTADDTVPYEGGAGIVATLMGVTFQPVPMMADSLSREEGCSSAPTETRGDGADTEEWDQCSGGTRVRLVTVTGGTHMWPLNGAVDATEEILDFFGIR